MCCICRNQKSSLREIIFPFKIHLITTLINPCLNQNPQATLNMAIAKFHSLRGEKSALIMVKPNQFVFSATPCYIPKSALPTGIAEGGEFQIPDGYTIVDMVDTESGEVRTTKDGEALKVLAY